MYVWEGGGVLRRSEQHLHCMSMWVWEWGDRDNAACKNGKRGRVLRQVKSGLDNR